MFSISCQNNVLSVKRFVDPKLWRKVAGAFFVGNYMSSKYGREILPSIIFKRLTSIPLLDLGKKCEQVFKVDQ